MAHRPHAAIGLDCAIGKDGAGVSGLWYYEALNIPAAAADVMTAEMGNGLDLHDYGVISRVTRIVDGSGCWNEGSLVGASRSSPLAVIHLFWPSTSTRKSSLCCP